MKTLFVDLETSPNICHTWSLFNVNIGINQIVTPGSTLCWSARWLGTKELLYDSVHKSSAADMVARLHSLFDMADCVVHFNGNKFDIPVAQREFILHGLAPPAPYAQIDLLRVVRKQFKFASNKLDFVARILGLGTKVAHKGHELWVGCMAGEVDSWRVMEKYNKMDVVLLEALYHMLLPWITNHPHTGLYEGTPSSCPNCGGSSLESRGLAYTKLSSYRRYRCRDCCTWTRGSKREIGATLRHVT